MLTDRKIAQLTTRFLTRQSTDLAILGVADGEAIENWWDDSPRVQDIETIPETQRVITPAEVENFGIADYRQSIRTSHTTVDRSTPEHSEFDRRQAIRRALPNVFAYDNRLIPAEFDAPVTLLRDAIRNSGNCDGIHNGNKHLLKWLLKTHPISNIEQMQLDEMKVVAVALIENDEVTIQTIVDTARRRRNG